MLDFWHCFFDSFSRSVSMRMNIRVNESYLGHFPIRSLETERPLMFAYWGTKGALPKYTLDLARVAAAQQKIRCSFSVSDSNELFEEYGFLADDLFALSTFKSKWAGLAKGLSLRGLRALLEERIRRDRSRSFISLMPHIWSPLLAPAISDAGASHLVVVHDADAHPGDRYGLTNRWLLREAAMADRVITLSRFVAERLVAAGIVSRRKISVLFHPDLNYKSVGYARTSEGEPLRVLLIGRILSYKGLRHVVDAVESLRSKGLPVELGVYGRGTIDAALHVRLLKLGATVVNKWLSHEEIKDAFRCHDVVIAAHTQASQSGVIAAAYGAGLPVIANPVGGLVEQVTDGVTGLLTDSPTSEGIAAAIAKLARDRSLLLKLRKGIAATREERSMERFFDRLSSLALSEPL